VSVFVVVTPSVAQLMENQLTMIRQMVQLSCNVSGWPTPHVSWTKDGKDLVPSSHINMDAHRLVITEATVRDSGIYQCWAENIAGRATLAARVLLGTPELVHFVSIYDFSLLNLVPAYPDQKAEGATLLQEHRQAAGICLWCIELLAKLVVFVIVVFDLVLSCGVYEICTCLYCVCANGCRHITMILLRCRRWS